MRERIKRIAQVVFGLALVLIVAVELLTYQSTTRLMTDTDQIVHTREVLVALEDTRSTLMDVQIGQRGYLLTGQGAFLAPYTEALARVDQDFSRLRRLIAGDPRQQSRLEILEALVAERMRFAQEAIRLRQDQGLTASVELMLTGRGTSLMNEARRMIATMKVVEEDRLRSRSATSRASAHQALLMAGLGGLLSVTLIILGGFVLGRELKRRRQREAELRKAHKSLDRRVQERTLELAYANAALKASEARLSLALANARLGYWGWDIPSGKVNWYGGLDTLYGRAEMMTFADFLKSVHADDRAVVMTAVECTLREGAPFEAEFRLLWPDGTVHWLLSKGDLERDAHDQPLRLSGINMDITERKQVEMALKTADRHKDEFLAMLAHELRNPLTPVLSAVEVLRHSHLDDPALNWARDLIHRQVTHMTQLVDDLLDVSRIAQGRLVLRKECIDLDAVVAQAVETNRPLIEARGHRLTVSLPEGPIPLEGDLTRLAQVVANLLNNAAKYTDPEGQIALIAERLEGEIVLRVKDTGIGIEPEVLPHVFEIFTQADRTLNHAQDGLGIGLALVKKLVELHGGRVEARSAGAGRGAEFVVWLPMGQLPQARTRSQSQEQAQPQGWVQPQAQASHGLCCRVLVVDDNADITQGLATLLSLDGHEVKSAPDGPTALTLARDFQPHIVLLDIGLPGMNGYEVASRLRTQPGMEKTILVAMTGYSREQDRQRAKESNFDHHLTKPVDLKVLYTLLDVLKAA